MIEIIKTITKTLIKKINPRPATQIYPINKKTNEIDCIYYVQSPDGIEWGDSVKSEYVSDSFDELANKLKDIWEDHANWK